MKRLLSVLVLSALLPAQAQASAGFSCETAENETPKLVIEGATPRSGGALINFGGVLEIDGRKLEFKQSDVKRYFGEGGVIRVRVSAASGDQVYTVNLNVRRNPKDEDDWPGTYEVTFGPKAKPKANTRRGKVQCAVE